MKHKNLFGATMLAATLAFSAAPFAQELKTGEVGFIVQLSGVSAGFGIGVQHAVAVAQEDLKASGIIDLTVYFEDHQQQPQMGLLGFEKIMDQHDVPVVIANASPIVLAIGPAAAEREKLVYNFAAVSPKMRTLAPWVVSGTPTSDKDGTQLADYMFNQLGLKNVAILHVNDQNGITFAEVFSNAFKEHGGNIAAVETNEPTASDMRTQLLKIKSTNPDALVILNNIPENGYTAAQAREIGITAPLFGNTFMLDPEAFKVAGDALEGVRGVTLRFDPEGSPDAKAFADKFAARAGRPPSNIEALAYDGTRLVGEAIAAVGNDPAAIREYIVSVSDWPGVAGAFNFDADGMVQMELSHFEIKDGKAVFYTP